MFTQENIVPAKLHPGSTTAGSCLAWMKLFPCNQRIQFMKSLQYCQDPGKVGQNFISVKRDRVVTNLETFDLAIKTTEKRFYQKDYHISSDAQGLLLKSIKDNNNPH